MENQINISNARKNLYQLADKVLEDGEVVNITTKKGSMILLSAQDYAEMEETMYFMSNPAMREKLLKGLNTPAEECVEAIKPWLFK